jgi:hypothetical protein
MSPAQMKGNDALDLLRRSDTELRQVFEAPYSSPLECV